MIVKFGPILVAPFFILEHFKSILFKGIETRTSGFHDIEIAYQDMVSVIVFGTIREKFGHLPDFFYPSFIFCPRVMTEINMHR